VKVLIDLIEFIKIKNEK